MFYLVLIFSGAIGFVPVTENGQQLFYALFVEGRTPIMVSDQSVLPSHFPMVSVDNSVVASSSEHSSILTDPVNGRETRIWFLDNEHIDVELPATTQASARLPISFVQAGETPSLTRPFPCLEGVDGVNLGWLPQMTELSSTGGEINPSYLAATAPAGLLAARMKIDTGKVGAIKLGLGSKTDVFDFKSLVSPGSTSSFSRAVPGAVQVVIEVPGCKVALKAREIDGTTETGRLNIEVKDCDKLPSPSRVEVNFTNIPLEDLVTDGKLFRKPVEHDHLKVDKHFELFYDLLRTPPPRNSRPVPHLANSSDLTSSVLIAACSSGESKKEVTRKAMALDKLSFFSIDRVSALATLSSAVNVDGVTGVEKFNLLDMIRTVEAKCPGTLYLPPSNK